MHLAIIVAYFVLMLVIGGLAKRFASDSVHFLVSGRNLGVVACMAVMVGEWIGGTSTVGVAEGGFRYGLSAGWYTLSNSIGVILFGLTLAAFYRKQKEYTVPAIMETYLGPVCAVGSSVLLTLVMIVVAAVQMVAAGTILHNIVRLEVNQSIALTGVVFIVYTYVGGLWAIAFTNFVHVIVIYAGMIIALALSLGAGGIAALKAGGLPASSFSMAGVGLSKISAWVIASVTGAFTAQAAVQPVLGARDERVAVRASLLSGVLIAPLGIMAALLGMVARVRFPGLVAKDALPRIIMSLPRPFGSMVLASTIAAVLSTVSPCILAAATLLTKDVYQKWVNRRATDRDVYFWSRAAIVACGFASILAATAIPTLLDTVYFAYTIRGTVFILLALGLVWKSLSRSAAFAALLVSTSAVIVWECVNRLEGAYPLGLHPMYVALALTCLVAVVGTVAAGWVRPRSRAAKSFGRVGRPG